MFNRILVGMLAVAMAGAIGASGYAFGRYLAKATGKTPIVESAKTTRSA
jgi:hypothetical protein